MKQLGAAPIPYESRLNRALRRQQEEREYVETAQRIARECDVELPVVLSTKVTADPADLRGIPAAARGVPGVMRGTSPHGWAEHAED